MVKKQTYCRINLKKSITRRPAIIGIISIFPFWRRCLLKNESVFLKNFLQHIFQFFPSLKNFSFSAKKTSQWRWKRHFQKNHLIRILQHICHLQPFWNNFRKTHQFSQKNPNFERFQKSYYFTRILQQICKIWWCKNSKSESVRL